MPQTPLRILYLITKSNPGGAQKYIYDLATAAQAAGHSVTVAAGGDGKLTNQLRAAKVEFVEIKNFARDVSVVKDLGAVFEIARLIRRVKPDVLHVTSSKAGGLGALVGRLLRVPNIVFTSHGLTTDEVWRPKWQRGLIAITTWLTLVLAHKNIMISTDTYHRARQMPLLKHKIFLVKNGLAEINFLEKTAARKELIKLPAKSIWLGGMGELHPNKNWSVLIRAMKNLPANVHLIIIGEGEEKTKLTNLIKEEQLGDRVHLLGYLNGAKYLKAFDIFILPSKKEGLPYVLLEAGLAALPVVASDLPGNRDIITTGETGFLVDPSPQLLATTLAMLVRDEGMRRRLGENLADFINANFSAEKMLKDTLSVYEFKTSGA